MRSAIWSRLFGKDYEDYRASVGKLTPRFRSKA